ncbi:MAG: DUF4340 domain-containing protein [Deltaproteobacteria bacterium]|nr:MAG: DUF4340 domain-containing protein [Deltaproteobacteria bacterium]
MDDRQVRILVVLTAMVAVLGLIYALAPRQGAEEPWAQEATHRVWTLEPDQVQTLSVTRGQGPPALLRRKGRTWQMVEPEAREADPRVVDRVLRELGRIELGVPLERTDPRELGLGEPPRGKVQVELRSGEQLELDLGDIAPVGWHTYARAPDGTLVVLPGHFDDEVLLPPSAFRESSVLRYELTSVVGVELHSPRGVLRVQRDEAGEWWLVDWGRADLDALENLVVSLLDLRVQAFHDELVPGGLTDPKHRAVVRLADGAAVEARFGDDLPMGRMVQTYAGDIGVLPSEMLALLDQGPTDLMDGAAFPIRRDGIDGIDLSIDGQRAELRGGQGRWQAKGLSGADAIRLVEAVRRARLDLPPKERLESLGERTGQVRIRQGDRGTRVIEIGSVEGGKRRLRDVSGGPITTLDESWIQTIVERFPKD